ncbi:MAG: GNAT family N-acetyltransferase [Eubacteriales bacterium]|jgi:GNAT superfamily N-acetyltransferase|nr:GNAT family N-acetyltransferase [Eubacteriales bacterium]MDD4422356.1 GNAT family N-acetyltransferase [Eubacteriales bacterium]HBR31737.1 GNAT family N-acetyltransferase [Clostridiales bacterium]
MPDMLVKLYELPDSTELYKELSESGIRIIRPLTPNKTKIHDWVKTQFSEGWADEIDAAFTRHPVSCFIAYNDNEKSVVGFAGYDCTYKAFFGPTGVDEAYRGKGIGRALCLRCMEALRDEGYAYAIIGSAGPLDFYKKICGAVVIGGSDPGIYANLI